MKFSARKGFTLLEVLVALAIFAFSAVVLASAYINVLMGYEAVDRAHQRSDDVRFARMALLTEADPDEVLKGGDFESTNNRRVKWKASFEPTSVADVFDVAFECEVSGPDLPKNEVTKEKFRLLRPTWSKADEREKLRSAAKDRILKIITTSK